MFKVGDYVRITWGRIGVVKSVGRVDKLLKVNYYLDGIKTYDYWYSNGLKLSTKRAYNKHNKTHKPVEKLRLKGLGETALFTKTDVHIGCSSITRKGLNKLCKQILKLKV